MQNTPKDELSIIDEKIALLVNDANEYNFTTIKEKVEEILKDVHMFLVDKEINSKAVDLYVKNVITQRNNLKIKEEKIKIENTQKSNYFLIEEICKKLDFEDKNDLIKKIEELEKKTNLELNSINNSL